MVNSVYSIPSIKSHVSSHFRSPRSYQKFSEKIQFGGSGWAGGRSEAGQETPADWATRDSDNYDKEAGDQTCCLIESGPCLIISVTLFMDDPLKCLCTIPYGMHSVSFIIPSSLHSIVDSYSPEFGKTWRRSRFLSSSGRPNPASLQVLFENLEINNKQMESKLL